MKPGIQSLLDDVGRTIHFTPTVDEVVPEAETDHDRRRNTT